ncbi:MAG: hypothetical protein AAF586_04735 [Planctomycetota bacterium]
MPGTRASSPRSNRAYAGRHRFQHWYRDNQVYFITSRCAGRFPAFADESAKQVFWRQFDRYVAGCGFVPWVTSLLDNHYHTVGYLRRGDRLGPMMQRLHGSVAKLVNDQLEARLRPFWSEKKDGGYFDGCLRDEKQARLAYGYVERQGVRHGLVKPGESYPHTRVHVTMTAAIRRASELRAFLYGVRYKRYMDGSHGG